MISESSIYIFFLQGHIRSFRGASEWLCTFLFWYINRFLYDKKKRTKKKIKKPRRNHKRCLYVNSWHTWVCEAPRGRRCLTSLWMDLSHSSLGLFRPVLLPRGIEVPFLKSLCLVFFCLNIPSVFHLSHLSPAAFFGESDIRSDFHCCWRVLIPSPWGQSWREGHNENEAVLFCPVTSCDSRFWFAFTVAILCFRS